MFIASPDRTQFIAKRLMLFIVLAMISSVSWSADRGNAELPKVLYIIPWKQAPAGNLVGKPVESLLDEALSSIDRNIFLREVSYYESLREYDLSNGSGQADQEYNQEPGEQE